MVNLKLGVVRRELLKALVLPLYSSRLSRHPHRTTVLMALQTPCNLLIAELQSASKFLYVQVFLRAFEMGGRVSLSASFILNGIWYCESTLKILGVYGTVKTPGLYKTKVDFIQFLRSGIVQWLDHGLDDRFRFSGWEENISVDVGLLGCNTVYTCRQIITFRRNIQPTSSGM
jgi:hypothetical protein